MTRSLSELTGRLEAAIFNALEHQGSLVGSMHRRALVRGSGERCHRIATRHAPEGFSLSIAKFQTQSASPSELVLPLADTLEVLQLMEQSGVSVIGWEGWLRYPDGKLGHSRNHPGTASADPLTMAETYAWLRSTMLESQGAHDRHPEVAGSELLFCISSEPGRPG